MDHPVKYLLFDFGGVLVDLDKERCIRSFAVLGFDVRPYLGTYAQGGIFSQLESGRIDATLNDEVVFYDYMNAHPDAPLKIAAENAEPTHVAFPLRKGEETAALREAMNEAIDTLRADGTLASLSNEFFGIDITSAS